MLNFTRKNYDKFKNKTHLSKKLKKNMLAAQKNRNQPHLTEMSHMPKSRRNWTLIVLCLFLTSNFVFSTKKSHKKTSKSQKKILDEEHLLEPSSSEPKAVVRAGLTFLDGPVNRVSSPE